MGIGTMTRVKNEKGSVVSVTLAKPTVQVITCDRMMNVYFDCDSGFRQRNALTADRFGGVTECHFSATK